MYGSRKGKINIRNTLGRKYTGKEGICYISTNRHYIIGQYPLEKNGNHAKSLFKPHSQVQREQVIVFWIQKKYTCSLD